MFTWLEGHWELVVFPLVGAAIGAVTNDVAIRMLFRPYRAWHLGSWRVPFTPGLIPAQRAVIARNIAETFEENLLSTREVHEFLSGEMVREKVAAKVAEMLDGLGPLAPLVRGFEGMITDHLLKGLEEMAEEAVSEGSGFDVARRIEDRINAMDVAELERLILGFSRRQFRHITFFGGVLGFWIGLLQAAMSLAVRGAF